MAHGRHLARTIACRDCLSSREAAFDPGMTLEIGSQNGAKLDLSLAQSYRRDSRQIARQARNPSLPGRGSILYIPTIRLAAANTGQVRHETEASTKLIAGPARAVQNSSIGLPC